MLSWAKHQTNGSRCWPTRVAFFVVLAMGLSGCSRSTPDCSDPEVARTIVALLRRQLKLTPYLRFIELDKAELKINFISTVETGATSKSCVAFVTYDVKLNDAGQQAKGRMKLLHSLVYELASEKQVYYRISRTTDGRVQVHVDRVGG